MESGGININQNANLRVKISEQEDEAVVVVVVTGSTVVFMLLHLAGCCAAGQRMENTPNTRSSLSRFTTTKASLCSVLQFWSICCSDSSVFVSEVGRCNTHSQQRSKE